MEVGQGQIGAVAPKKMDVIGFLCVSLGSHTAQIHDNLGSRRACAPSEAGYSSQNGDRA
jgi:hypothetical protein